MKEMKLWMMAVILTICGAVTLTSCHDDDDVMTERQREIIDLWYAQYDAEGTYMGKAYTRVIEKYEFYDNGTGVWDRFFFNDEEADPFDDLGGGSGGLGAFRWTYHEADNTITVTLTEVDQAPEQDRAQYDPLTRKMEFIDGGTDNDEDDHIRVTGLDAEEVMLSHGNDTWANLFSEWHTLINGGAGLRPDNYNANIYFTRDEWRNEEYIYIYDGKGPDKDERGNTGYTIVPLPWNKELTTSNLPFGFCDDITPANGWELVLNNCGERRIMNNNFFAVYNKYTGTLRFFTYVPEVFNVSTANDHLWEVDMDKSLAQRSIFTYGLPSGETMKDWTAIGQTGEAIKVYTTPWVESLSSDGLITPNAGWWAFDVDLSLYRPGDDYLNSQIRLQMRSWDKTHVSLMSKLSADLKGTVDFTQPKKASGSTGFGLSTIFSKSGDLKTMSTSIFQAVTKIKTGNYMDVFAPVTAFAKSFASMVGLMPSGSGTGESQPLTGNINLHVSGNIDTNGVVEGSRTVVGVVNPQFSMKNLDTSHSTVGQGIWNIKHHPVVYRTNVRYRYLLGKNIHEDITITDYLWHPYNKQQVLVQGHIMFFDPSSIEVELNPNVFPEDQIEWMEVIPQCGVRAVMMMNGTDKHRQALGLAERLYSFKDPVTLASGDEMFFLGKGNQEGINWDLYENFKRLKAWGIYDGDSGPFDFYFSHQYNNYDGDMTYPALMPIQKDIDSQKNVENVGIFGRGYDNDYIIEPHCLFGLANWNSTYYYRYYAPAYEVNVMVLVKMKGQANPIILNRIYLPELKNVMYDDLGSTFDNIKNSKRSDKEQGHTKAFDHHVRHIQDILNWVQFNNSPPR